MDYFEEIIKVLLKNRDFKQVCDEFSLYNYDLIKIILYFLDPMFGSRFRKDKYSEDDINLLKDIYKKNAVIFDISDEPFLFISDTHMGSVGERLDYFECVMDYCKYNQIRCIIHGGDIGDGTIFRNNRSEWIDNEIDAFNQIKYILERYPYSADVVQFLLAGNHDNKYCNYDILKELVNDCKEKNIYPLGYYQAFFSINGHCVSLEHENHMIPEITFAPTLLPHDLTIHGHSHISHFYENDIYLPTLSDNICHNNTELGLPGFLVVFPQRLGDVTNLQFKRFYFKNEECIKDEKQYVYTLKR